jgi:hypothetical protein
MAKLTLTDAARVAGVSRVTLHRYIKAGKLRQQADGKVDTADLTTAGFVLHPETLRAPSADATLATVPETGETSATPVTRMPALDYQERYIALLEQEVEDLRTERERLRREKDALQEETRRRDQMIQEYQTHVLQMFQEQRQLLQQMQQRLLEAPRPTPPAEAASPSPRATLPGALPATWRRVLDYLREHPGPQRATAVEQALGLKAPARFVCKRMTDAGLLVRVAPGVYALRA